MTDFGDERPRKRAKLACTNCNARRVKCDVTDRQPCRNCEMAQAVCETRESKRGKHPRKPKAENGKHHHAPVTEYVAGTATPVCVESSSALTLVALQKPILPLKGMRTILRPHMFWLPCRQNSTAPQRTRQPTTTPTSNLLHHVPVKTHRVAYRKPRQAVLRTTVPCSWANPVRCDM